MNIRALERRVRTLETQVQGLLDREQADTDPAADMEAEVRELLGVEDEAE